MGSDTQGYLATTPSTQILSLAQIIGEEKQAGFPQSQWATGAAVAELESGGLVGAIGNNTGSFAHQEDLGLFQIGYDPTTGLRTQYNPNTLVTDPQYNALVAEHIYSSSTRGWSQWSAYKPESAAFKDWEAQAQKLVDTGGIIDPGQSGSPPVSDASGVTQNLAMWFVVAVVLIFVIGH